MMTVHDRKVALLQRRITVAVLAQRASCSPQLIRAVILEREKSRRIRKVIARAMGKTLAEAFG